MFCGISHWILEEKEDIGGKMGKVHIRSVIGFEGVADNINHLDSIIVLCGMLTLKEAA